VALEGLAASQAAPHRQVQRAKALLLVADGVANSHIAQRIGVSFGTVRAWRDRFAGHGLAELGQVHRWRGRKPSISEEQIAEIVELTLHSKPKGHTHWSCRTMADTGGSSPPHTTAR
jgi:transposase